jgi:hypothetical protein
MNMCIHPQEEAPVPWKYEGSFDTYDLSKNRWRVLDANGNPVFINTEQQLERLCQAVNNHAALVEALKETLALLRTSLAPDGMFAKEEDWLRHKINKAARELDAALAAAGETK